MIVWRLVGGRSTNHTHTAAHSRSSLHTFHRSGSQRSSYATSCGTFTNACARNFCGFTS